MSVTIDPALLKQEELGMVQDLVVAASNAALTKSQQMVEAEIEKVTGGHQDPGAGLEAAEAVPANDPIAELVSLLSRLPGIGERTAARLTYFVLGSPRDYAQALGARARRSARSRAALRGLRQLRDRAALRDLHRPASATASVLCVVARPPDVVALERGGSFRGRYHVLHALLAPLDGIGPEALELSRLLARVRKGGVHEVIVATPLSVEGEATALYLAAELRAARRPRARASPAACPTAASSSSATRSRWRARSKAAASCEPASRRRPGRRRSRPAANARRYADAALGVAAVAIVALMIVPLPTPLLDLLIASNLAIAVVMLLLAMYDPGWARVHRVADRAARHDAVPARAERVVDAADPAAGRRGPGHPRVRRVRRARQLRGRRGGLR